MINSESMMEDFSQLQFGNYRLINSLGQGSFASVYLGEHLYLKRLAAIKVLRTVLSERETRLFLEEAKILSNLSHPHIVRVLEFAVAHRWTTIHNKRVQENIPFLVTDYAAGGTLRSRYPDGTRLPLRDVVHIIKQIAAALQYAHNSNVIHRDIKPENLLLNEQQEVMLSDFGLAVFAPTPDFQSLQDMAGTLPYAAPEQLQGRPDFASDQYSLGIIAYEWLCGERPFQGDDVEIIMQHISSPPPPLRRKNPSISRAIEEVILLSLAKEPRERYRDVQTFARALETASQVRDLRPFTAPSWEGRSQPLAALSTYPSLHYFSQQPASAVVTLDDALTQPAIKPTTRTAINQQMARFSTTRQRNRLRMLQKVHAIWIRGVLRQSLFGASFIPLGLDERQDAVAGRVPRQVASPPRPLAASTAITEAYDQTGGELLILGEAGSGKTTLLLELCRNLLDRAEHDESHPIPVVFLLSSWSEKQLPLGEWFIEELSNKYQVPRPLGELWVHNEMLLPLLDGLDEMAPNERTACVTAINAYKEEHGLASLVVSCRLADYLLTPSRVLLHSAVILRPLTPQQIEAYLQSAGEKFEVILRVLQADPALQKLVTTPLMLNIITLAYQEKSPEELVVISSSVGRYQRILSTYVEQMLLRRPAAARFEPQQMVRFLTNLAHQMQQHNQRIFYIDYMQPDWIPGRLWPFLYRWVAVLLPGALIGALVGLLSNVLLFHTGIIGSLFIDTVYGTVMGYLFSGREGQQPPEGLSPSLARPGRVLLDALQAALFVGLVTGFWMGLADGWRVGLANGLFLGACSIPLSLLFGSDSQKGKPEKNVAAKSRQSLRHFRNGILAGIPCGLTSLIAISLDGQKQANAGFAFFLSLGVRDSLCYALMGSLLSFLLLNNDGFIHRAEILSWSWTHFWRSIKKPKSLVYSSLIGIVVGLIYASLLELQGYTVVALGTGVIRGELVAVSIHLTFACLRSFSSGHLPDQRRFNANEGIRRSLKHGLMAGVVSGPATIFLSLVTIPFAVAASYGPLFLLKSQVWLAIVYVSFSQAPVLAPSAALLMWLLFGGLAFLQHYILRFVLWCTGIFPPKLVTFLEHAVDCVLLHRVGGGYIFIHRLLLEYFASLDRRGQPAEEEIIFSQEPLVRPLDMQF